MRVYLSDAFFEFGSSLATCWIYHEDEKVRVRSASNGFSVYRYKLREKLESTDRGKILTLANLVGTAQLFKERKKDDVWDLFGCASFSVNGDRIDDRLLDDGTMVRSWDNTIEPPVRVDVGDCSLRPSSWPSFRYDTGQSDTWVVVSGDRVGLKCEFLKEERPTIRKVLNIEDVDRLSLGTVVGWREILWRRYGTEVGFWVERQIDARIEEHADETCDSIRFCDMNNQIERDEFYALRSCCMSYEESIEHESGAEFRIGFNYGH